MPTSLKIKLFGLNGYAHTDNVEFAFIMGKIPLLGPRVNYVNILLRHSKGWSSSHRLQPQEGAKGHLQKGEE